LQCITIVAITSAINSLNYCIGLNTALYKIFHVDRDHLLLLNVPMLLCSAEKRTEKFMNSLLTMRDLRSVLEVYAKGVCSG